MRRLLSAIVGIVSAALIANAETITTSAPGPTIFPVTNYGAVCDGVTDDTTAIQAAVTAWKAAAANGMATILGPGTGNKCKVTAPIDFTVVSNSSPTAWVVRDLYLKGVFNYTGPVGTLIITNGGNYTTPGTYTNVPLTGGAGSGCTAASVVVSGGAVTSVVLSAPGCGTAYEVSNTLSAATANLGGTGTGGLVLTVDTLSGGAIIDAVGARYLQWDNVVVEGDCTSVPNAGIAIGTYFNFPASEQKTFGVTSTGCFKFTAYYDIASEVGLFEHLTLSNNKTTGNTYALVLDGMNHFNWSSTFKTFTLSVDTALSFNDVMFSQLDARVSLTNASAVPVWIGKASGHKFYNSYVAAQGSCGVKLYSFDTSTRSSQMWFIMHMETTSLVNAFCLSGGDVNFKIYDLFYMDFLSSPTTATFAPDSNISTVSAYGLKVQLQGMGAAATVFGNPSIWTVVPDRIEVPASANYVAPGSLLAGGWICIGTSPCTPSGPGAVKFGAGSFTYSIPSGTSGWIRMVGCGPGGGGGGGAQTNGGTNAASGGAGGGGAGCFDRTMTMADLTALTTTLQIRVGAGGAGGTPAGGATTPGNAGAQGNATTCISTGAGCTGNVLVQGGRGGGGGGGQIAQTSGGGGGGCGTIANTVDGGTATGGTGTTGGAASTCGSAGGTGVQPSVVQIYWMGGNGGSGSPANGAGTGLVGGQSFMGAPGGAPGGGIPNPAGANNGGPGGIAFMWTRTQSAGGTAGTPNGVVGATSPCVPGWAGAGGYGNNAGNGGNGVTGVQGGGGGGAGSVTNGNTPGTGGNGGDGFVCLYFGI